MITFKEYRKQTKKTSNYLLKVCGVIFSVCFCIIYLLTDSSSDSLPKNILYYTLCILMGNLFAVFIWIVAIYTSFKVTKRAYQIIENLPKDIVDSYKISLLFNTIDDKNHYPECKVVGEKDKFVFLLRRNGTQMFFTLWSNPSTILNKKYELDRKYRREHIELTGYGFMETSKRKSWHNITKTDFDNRLQRLIEITQTENPDYSESYDIR